MKNTKVYCRSCGNRNHVLLRKTAWIKTWIKHKLTGADVWFMKKFKAKTQSGASVTGVPCPRCKKHKLARC